MTRKTFLKALSANDVGATGGHQGGILIPKSETELLAFLPWLDPDIKNPDAWLDCVDEAGNRFRFRYVYYNNRLHDETGTRNEYRITYMTQFFRDVGARAGDAFEISHSDSEGCYAIRVVRQTKAAPAVEDEQVVRIKLTGWRRVH
ncbi:EcoRII N-terminal effector-binding domain-containing protein [Mesorhizobium sp. WSM2561]|uniref:EcoRII N-terminal effector-binding domain-containing protein n=1 Tax=Mesorhizobium sp. WSM2561 TaxID=1040985 RepID=UPI000484E6B5|nr:EcoRII N-terminal effector-binding domain-containing protein [Mesorhizobium sp. WSM2561]